MSGFSKLACALTATLFATTASAQDWQTAWNNPGDDKFVGLDYPVVFVSNAGHAEESSETAPHFGLDVLSANNPSAHGAGGGLFVLMPNDGSIVKLFPLPEHEAIPGLIDTPLGQLEKGAVCEPNVSEDGRIVYFAWFHDQTWKKDNGGWQHLKLSYKGADLYRLDLGPLMDNPSTDPASLPIMRLTTKEYDGPPKNNVKQTLASRQEHATNPGLVDQHFLGYWGNVEMHLVEMRTATGLKAVWVSNRLRLENSNASGSDSNHNFTMFIADILPDGSLGPARPWMHYTTTSALSPTQMPDGISFSYQSSTEGYRRWDIQAVHSNGVWTPLIGYAHRSELFHFGTYVVAPGSEGAQTDHFVGVKYYNQNDGGFGQLHRINVSAAGVNVFDPEPFATAPIQLNDHLTTGVVAQDMPSPQTLVDGVPTYIGKFSTPRAGRIGGEYLMCYTPTSANRWLDDADGNKCVFDVHIGYRPNLGAFEPHEDVDVEAGTGLRTVVDDSSGVYSLLWPTPMLSWQERYGVAQQSFSAPAIDPDSTVDPGEPYAQVGTSAIWNTDVRPYDCYLNGGEPFEPAELNANERIALLESVDGLRYVPNQNDFCQYLTADEVLAIAIHMTSQRTDIGDKLYSSYDTEGDETNGSGDKEAAELLGVFDVNTLNVADQSFQAVIPARVPFEFQLLDKQYGMKLVDVRSWHSLQPREQRIDCGGCHQHEAGFGIAFEGTEASQKPPLDMTAQTPAIIYDEDCKPELTTLLRPTYENPEWRADVWPGFSEHCGTCHDSTESVDAAALAAYDFDDEESAWQQMIDRWYANSSLGALGSPVFWAAYGERTDGRDNTLPQYQPNIPSQDYGYHFSSVHATTPGLCAQENPDLANWVMTLGRWIDNHMPRNTGESSLGYHFDRYPPAVDFGIDPSIWRLRFGWWDNSDLVDVELLFNGTPVINLPSQSNGSVAIPIPFGLSVTDTIGVSATDADGNRSVHEQTVLEIYLSFITEPE